MKKVFLGLLILLMSSSVANAQVVNNQVRNTTREEVRDRINEKQIEIEKKREEIRERIQVRKATVEAKLQERNRQRITYYFGRLNNRFEAYIDRLNTIASRIEARLEIISEDSDKDLTDLSEKLAEAKELLYQAETQLAATNDSLTLLLESNTPKEAYEILKDEVISVKNDLKEAHSLLVEIITQIQGLRTGQS